MPRKRRKEKAVKKVADIPVIAEMAVKHRKENAEKALVKAKKLEAQQLKIGHKWQTNGKTRRLVKPIEFKNY